MSKKLANLIATYFGLGLSPKAPGTVGSLGTLPLAFFLVYYTGLIGLVPSAIIIAIIGIWATDKVIAGQEEKDPGKVVIDEVVGQLLSFIFVAEKLKGNLGFWEIYLMGFVFFRFYDIKKMGPVKWFDSKVRNAVGVMMDDVCAGLMASITLWGLSEILHLFN